jgi:membrane-associated phospholipid phosphatase
VVERSDEHLTSDAAAWAAIAVLAMALALAEWINPIPIAFGGLASLTAACGTLGLVHYFYRTVRHRPQFAVMTLTLMQVLLFSGIGLALSYLVVRHGAGLWDEQLRAADLSLGFDWLSWAHWVDRHRLLVDVLRVAYASLIPQIVVLLCGLGFAHRLNELRAVMLAAILSGASCIFISSLVPALGYPALLHVTSADFQRLDPWAGVVHLSDYRALRDGTMAQLDFTRMQGIITFPSYHAGLSGVTFCGFLRVRSSLVRWPGMALALLTIAATPFLGGHYLVDVLAGLAIALVSIAFAQRAVRWQPTFRALPFRRSREAFAP